MDWARSRNIHVVSVPLLEYFVEEWQRECRNAKWEAEGRSGAARASLAQEEIDRGLPSENDPPLFLQISGPNFRSLLAWLFAAATSCQLHT